MKIPEFLFGSASEVAPRLLGWRLISNAGGEVTEIAITEVEAYSEEDPASHSYGGMRPRTAVMFGQPGALYVYRSYGVHWCANVVCGPPNHGAAVLLRGGMPKRGTPVMRDRRQGREPLTVGPGNLTQALAITGAHNGLQLFSSRSEVTLRPGPPPESFLITPRIGITKAADRPWRFVASAAL